LSNLRNVEIETNESPKYMTNFALSCLLFYADDIKVCLLVHGCQDCFKIQIDLNKLAEWCKATALELNVDKSKLITFSRLHRSNEFSCMLGGDILDR
jgi:hypothetical protein